MKVYFAGSIRGGRIDANLYERLIKYIQKTDVVLTEHVGNLNLSEEGQTVTEIYNQDTNWLRESDVLIAECTCPSLGVGYELAYAERYCYSPSRSLSVQRLSPRILQLKMTKVLT